MRTLGYSSVGMDAAQLELMGIVAGETVDVHQYRVGPGRNFVYLVVDRTTRRAAAVDPAWNPIGLLRRAAELGVEVEAVLLTHTHPDHLGTGTRHRPVPGVRELLEKRDVPVWIHEAEADRVERFAGVAPEGLQTFADEAGIPLGDATIRALHTPGHTPGGASYLVDDMLLSGDTLFVRNVGSVDHPSGDVDALYCSLRKLMDLPPGTRVLSGHDYGDIPVSTIGREIRLNAYFRPLRQDQFRILLGQV